MREREPCTGIHWPLARQVRDKRGTATTLSDAERRASELRKDLAFRGTHADVLDFCRAELIADNYFTLSRRP